MTSPWQLILSMRIILKKWRIRHTHYYVTRDNAKLACHCTARYKIEWIYMKTMVRGPDNLELALEMRKKERLRNGHLFEHLVLACTIDLMNDLGLVR